MVELCLRLAMCACLLAAGKQAWIPWPLAWTSASLLAGLSVLGWLVVERKGKAPATLAICALGESLVLSYGFASLGMTDRVGFLAFLPCVLAAARHGASLASMAPIAAGGLVGAASMHSARGIPSALELVHALGMLSMALLIGRRSEPERPAPLAPPEPRPQWIDDGIFHIRESYRKLRDSYRDLERRTKRDRIVSAVARIEEEGERFYPALASVLKDLSGADDVSIYTVAREEKLMVVRSAAATLGLDGKCHAFHVDLTQAPSRVRKCADLASRSIAGAHVANVLLVDRGTVLGMVSALDPDPARLAEVRSGLEEAAPHAARLVARALRAEAKDRRATELRLLYEIVSTSAGASTPSVLAARVAHELFAALRTESVAVFELVGGTAHVLAQEGRAADLLDCMSFAKGSGLEGWIAIGAPEVVLSDARADERCDPDETLRRRIGSFAAIPVRTGEGTVGFISAAGSVAGAIGNDKVAMLRLVAGEMARAWERLTGPGSLGLMSPREFAQSTEGRTGSLVILEPLKREESIQQFGVDAYRAVLRKLAHQIRARVPAGGFVCRRDRGDFVVFLDTTEDQARNWANEVAATAALIPMAASGAGPAIPLALRAKVAALTTQKDQLSVAKSS